MTGSIIRRSMEGLSLSFVLVASVLGCWAIRDPAPPTAPPQATSSPLTVPEETKHLKNVRQLTFGGQSARSLFLPRRQNTWIFSTKAKAFHATNLHDCRGHARRKARHAKLVSTGKGRTTCSYFFPSGDRVLFSSTHAASPDCPPKPITRTLRLADLRYLSNLYAKADGSELKQLTHARGYNAESTVTRDGKHIVFTSTRNGDLDIYTMNADGSNVKQLTNELGYDGGPFWSYDARKSSTARASQNAEEIAEYKDLLSKGLIRPGNLEIWVMNADGSNKHQVTRNGAANFRALLASRRKAHHLRIEHGRSEKRPRFRSLPHQRRRQWRRAHHLRTDFDAFPMFLFRRQAAGVGVQSQRQSPA